MLANLGAKLLIFHEKQIKKLNNHSLCVNNHVERWRFSHFFYIFAPKTIHFKNEYY